MELACSKPPFTLLEPIGRELPVIVEVPHAGLAVDPLALAFLVAPLRSLARDADLYMDRIASVAPSLGATLLVARASRFVVDLNRAPDDFDGDAVEGGPARLSPRGLVWRLTTDGDRALLAPLPRAELERRLDAVYRPYHEALDELIERKRARFGEVVLLSAHSMPTEPRPPSGPPPKPPRADLVPGTRGRTTASSRLIDGVDATAARFGLGVRHDDPYRGGFTTQRHGHPHDGIHAVQIEVARRLYMDEATHRIDALGMAKVQGFLGGLIEAFGEGLEGRAGRESGSG